MRRPLPPIDETLEDLQTQLRRCRDGRLKWRLQLLILVKDGQVSSRQEAAERLAQHRNTIGRWLAQYERAGLPGVLRIRRAGAPLGGGGLSPEREQALRHRLSDPNGLGSYQAIRYWFYEEFGQRIPYSTMYRWVRSRLKAKLKRPRPTHPKKTSPMPPPLRNALIGD